MKKLFFTLIALVVAQITFAYSASFTYSTTALGNNLLYLTCNVTSSTGSVSPTATAYIEFLFGDGSTSSAYLGSAVSHNYASAGTYTVKEILTVVDSGIFICSDTATQSVTVSYAPCASSFTSVTDTGGNVTFTATTPAGTSGLTYLWSFGDGSYGYGNPITHTYANNGIYPVNLYDSTSGCSYQNTGSASVNTASIGSSCVGSSALFTSSVSGLTVSFTNTSTYSGFSASPAASWWFSDGATSTLLSPTHTFASAGTYTAMLTMTWFDTLNLNTCWDSISHSVTVFGNTISGNISIDSAAGNPMNPTFKVWLINFDSATNSLSAVDSVNVIGNYWLGSYVFNNEPTGSYRVKAALTNGPTSGTAAVPTYGFDSLYWHGANVINFSGSGINSGNNIRLLDGTVTSGPGFVAGNVSAGANKGTQTTGMPVANLTMFLENMSGKVLAYTITDASGDYHFSNFPTGSYKIYPEILGYITTAATVVVGAAQVNNIDFTQHTISKTVTPSNSTGIVNVTENTASFNVFPNPGSGLFNISWSSKTVLQNAHANVTDIVGNKVFETDLNMQTNNGYTQLNIANLTSGIYFINIKAEGINYSSKVVLQH